jgi:aspartyl protease family protein
VVARWTGSAVLCVGLLAACGAAAAQTVLFAGSMGRKALIVVDGQPHTLAVGESAAGVTLLQLADGQALVQRGGATTTLRLGGAPARLAAAAPGATPSDEIVLPVGLGGHYTASGAINGRPVQFMVDTGATLVAIGRDEAERIGLDWRKGTRAATQTANGAVPVHLVSLNAVRVGEVEVANVAAVVVPAPLPYVLLGNSFLARFDLRRDNDVLRLSRRP